VLQEGNGGRWVRVDHERQPLPYQQRPARTGHRLLRGVLRPGRAASGR